MLFVDGNDIAHWKLKAFTVSPVHQPVFLKKDETDVLISLKTPKYETFRVT